MKRREEIENAAKQKYPYEGGTKGLICENSIPIFIQGAEWADKTMIEKACKWLRERLSDNITYVPESFYGQPKPVISEEGLKDFIKYLEE